MRECTLTIFVHEPSLPGRRESTAKYITFQCFLNREERRDHLDFCAQWAQDNISSLSDRSCT